MPTSRIISSHLPADFQQQLSNILPSRTEAYNFIIQFIEFAATAPSSTDVKNLSILSSEDFQKRVTPRENFLEEDSVSPNEQKIQDGLLRIFNDYTSFDDDDDGYLPLEDVVRVLQKKPEYGCLNLPLNYHAVKNILLKGFQGYQFEFEDRFSFSGDVEFTQFRILRKDKEDTDEELVTQAQIKSILIGICSDEPNKFIDISTFQKAAHEIFVSGEEVLHLVRTGFDGYEFDVRPQLDESKTTFRLRSIDGQPLPSSILQDKTPSTTDEESQPEENSFEILKKDLIEKLKFQPYATAAELYQQIYEDYFETDFYVDKGEIYSILDQRLEFEEVVRNNIIFYKLAPVQEDPEWIKRVRPYIARAFNSYPGCWIAISDLLAYIQNTGNSISARELSALLGAGHLDYGFPQFDVSSKHNPLDGKVIKMYKIKDANFTWKI